MKDKIDFNKVVLIEEMKGDGPKDTELLKKMYLEAKDYILSFDWCDGLDESYYGLGIAGIVAVFLFKIKHKRKDVDDYLWIVVGDLPPAYLVCDEAPNPACALDVYIYEMQLWVDAVKEGNSVDGLIPVNVSPELEYADMLCSRLKFLDNKFLKYYANDLKA